jgi:hypothetical protein
MKLFYIRDARDKSEMALWWRPEGKGYTYHVDEAGLFTDEEVQKITRSRSTDVPVPREIVETAMRPIATRSNLEKASADKGPVEVTINGTFHVFQDGKRWLTYEDVVEAAYPGKSHHVFSVVYSYRADKHKAGSLIKGQGVTVHDGVRFHVADTSNA